MSDLIIPVGIPGCGKSTYGKTFFNKTADLIRSTDGIREEVFGDINDQSNNDDVFKLFHETIADDLEDGFRVFADATNLTYRARENLRTIAVNARADIHLVIFDNAEQAVLRNLARTERVVPEHVMYRMLAQYEQFRLMLAEEIGEYKTITEIRSFS